MHPNVRKGNRIHAEHFQAIREAVDGGGLNGWKAAFVNRRIPGAGHKRPDWVLYNEEEKRAVVVDITSKYAPRHYQKGMEYVDALRHIWTDPEWEIQYVEDYYQNLDNPARPRLPH